MKRLAALVFFQFYLLMPIHSFADSMPLNAEQDPLIGNLDVFIFKDSQPRAGIKFNIEDRAFVTDADGAVYLELPVGRYELGFDQDKKSFQVGEGLTTRIIINSGNMQNTIEVSEPPLSDLREAQNQKERKADFVEIHGKVLSADTRVPLEGAKIYSVGRETQTALSKSNGEFVFFLPEGEYAFSIIHKAHASFTTGKIKISQTHRPSIHAELAPLAQINLQEIIVTAPQLSGSLASLIQERKNSANVTDALAAEQISKAGDSDAGSALRRATGLTLMDGKYVYVRGLGERYSASVLNGSILPSPHPARKVVPLDLFPTSMLESITIQKTYTPDMPGEFGGGIILLRTKAMPDKAFFSFGTSTTYTAGVTGKDGLFYKGGDIDFTGFDDGSRALPEAIRSRATDRKVIKEAPGVTGFNAEEIVAMGAAFEAIYKTERKKIPLSKGFNFSFGNRLTLSPSIDMGLSFATIYGQDFSHDQRRRTRYNVENSESGVLAVESDSKTEATRSEVKFGNMLFSGIQIRQNSEIKNTTMLLRKSENYAQIEDRFYTAGSTPFLKTTLSWQERQLFVNQSNFHHTHKEGHQKLEVDYRHTYAQALLSAPDRRSYTYTPDQDTLRISASPERHFADLIDHTWDDALDFKNAIDLGDKKKITLLAGAQVTNRQRQSDVRRFNFGSSISSDDNYKNPEEIFSRERLAAGDFTLEESTIATDNYNAQQNIQALYGAFDLELWDWFRFYTGIRNEDSQQKVSTFELHNPDGKPITSNLTTRHTLPVFSLTFTLAKDMQLRLSRSKTISRPDFKELSEAEYYDDDNGISVKGNRGLRAASIISHDLRWEWYFKDNQSVSLGGFQKDFDDPIELVITPQNEGEMYSFSNANTAIVQGVEADFRVNLHQGQHWLRRLFLAGNSTFIKSEVDLSNFVSTQTSKKRPLQGQASYIHNYTLGYDEPSTKSSLSFLYNQFGERIREVGANGRPDVKEQAYGQMDVVGVKTWGKGLKAGLKIRNLFPKDSIFKQGPELSQTRKTYRSYSADIAFTF